jgi:hypothetical protein
MWLFVFLADGTGPPAGYGSGWTADEHKTLHICGTRMKQDLVFVACCEKCARSRPVLPSAIHREAETRFERDIVAVCSLTHATIKFFDLCKWVAARDDEVRRGLVRRSVAASLASRFYVCDLGDFSCTLLYKVLRDRKHGEGLCQCLSTILAWGTCATVVCAGHVHNDHVTAVGLYGCSTWASVTLRAYGSMPWFTYRPGLGPDAGKVGIVIKRALFPLHCQLQLQWLRWHARHVRRLWVKLQQCVTLV